jgi:hypothetical protein
LATFPIGLPKGDAYFFINWDDNDFDQAGVVDSEIEGIHPTSPEAWSKLCHFSQFRICIGRHLLLAAGALSSFLLH